MAFGRHNCARIDGLGVVFRTHCEFRALSWALWLVKDAFAQRYTVVGLCPCLMQVMGLRLQNLVCLFGLAACDRGGR